MTDSFRRLAFLLLFLLTFTAPAVSQSLEVEVLRLYWRDVGDVYESLNGLKSESGVVTIDKMLNAIIVRDRRENIDSMRKLLKKLDVKRKQVRITVGVHTALEFEKRSVKVDWKVSGNGWVIGTLPESDVSSTPLVSLNFSTQQKNGFSSQMLLLMEGTVGSIFVGREIPLPQKIIRHGINEGIIESSFAYKKVGASLTVLPRILGDEVVLLKITPMLSDLNGSGTVSLTTATVEVRLKKGEKKLIASSSNDSGSFTYLFLHELLSSQGNGESIISVTAEIE